MSPRNIVAEAQRRKIDIIAICDHNSAENVRATIRAARGKNICVIPGMEITSREEIHILGWFPSPLAALEVQAKVYANLPGTNDPEKFGLQVVANELDEVVDFDQHLLIGATTLTIEEIVRAIKRAGGLAVAAHIDREGFGIIGQIGFIPENLPLDALEVSANLGLPGARVSFQQYAKTFPLVCSSDAHQIDELGRGVTEIECENASFAEIKNALRGFSGRRIC